MKVSLAGPYHQLKNAQLKTLIWSVPSRTKIRSWRSGEMFACQLKVPRTNPGNSLWNAKKLCQSQNFGLCITHKKLRLFYKLEVGARAIRVQNAISWYPLGQLIVLNPLCSLSTYRLRNVASVDKSLYQRALLSVTLSHLKAISAWSFLWKFILKWNTRSSAQKETTQVTKLGIPLVKVSHGRNCLLGK